MLYLPHAPHMICMASFSYVVYGHLVFLCFLIVSILPLGKHDNLLHQFLEPDWNDILLSFFVLLLVYKYHTAPTASTNG